MNTLDLLRLASQSIQKERTECLLHLLRLHNAYEDGVTAREAAEWLGLEQCKSSETSVGIMLMNLKFKRYRTQSPTIDGGPVQFRLFRNKPTKGWTK